MKKQILLVALLPLFAPVAVQAQDKIAAATNEQKVDEPNARLELARAAKAIVVKSNERILEREREVVASNAEGLQIIRGALQLPFHAAPLPEAGKFSEEELMEKSEVFTRPMAGYRQMARLLVTESRVRAADKDFVGAMQSALDAQRMGILIQSDGPPAQILVGSALEGIGRHQLRALLPQLDLANLKIALRELSQRQATAPTFTHNLRAAVAWDLLFYEALLQNVPQPVAQQMRTEWQRLAQAEIAQSQVAYIISAQQARVDFLEEYMEDLDEEVPLPDALAADVVPADVVTNLVAEQFALNQKSYRYVRLLYENNRTQNALLLAEFALRAYEIEHNKPAQSWDDLVPAYLPEAPADPFDYEHSLRLTTRDGKTVPYSIGPDGLDDKGLAIDNGEGAGYARFQVQFNSRGDIVSGINVQ